MKMIAWLGAFAAAMTLAACNEYHSAPPPSAPVGSAAPTSAVVPTCFRTSEIRNHTVGDEHTIYLNVAGTRVYKVVTNGACFAGATTSDPIITQDRTGSNQICKAIDLDLSVSMGGFPRHCIVQSIAPLSPTEVAALPPNQRP